MRSSRTGYEILEDGQEIFYREGLNQCEDFYEQVGGLIEEYSKLTGSPLSIAEEEIEEYAESTGEITFEDFRYMLRQVEGLSRGDILD